jgi:DNA polymerase
MYVVAYAKGFNVDPEVVVENKKSGDGSMRQYGKTMELACGYQGGVGAFRTMGGPAVEAMTDDEIQPLVSAWRKAHSNVVQLWYGVERAAKAAIRNPDDVAFYDKLQFDMKDDWLRIKLPSGRYLSYRNAEIDDGRISFDGVNQFSKKWGRIETYGGKLVENIVQAVARDVFMTGMVGAEEHGYEVCIRVHDELITEVPDTDEYSVGQLAGAMSTNPSWAVGLPLAAAGFETHRYKKD